jgi:hypothetical protein
MPICEACGQDKLDMVGCTVTRIIHEDGVYERVRVGEEWYRSQQSVHACEDCCAPNERFHHTGCHQEPCPRCEEQLILCWCGERLWEDGVLSGG